MSAKRLNYSDMFPGRFLHADELDGKEWTLTITDVYQEKLGGRKKARELDTIISFGETPKEYVLNPTNGAVCVAMWGTWADKWVGHKVTVAPVKDPSGLGRSGLKIVFIGSPELEEPREVRLPGGLKEGELRTLRPTVARAQAQVDVESGEVFVDEPEPAPEDDIDAALAPATPIRPVQVTHTQLSKIAALRKSTGIYEVEWAALLDSYGVEAAGELTKETAEYVISALQERAS